MCEASGGKFGSGFLAAGVGSLADSVHTGSFGGDVVVHAVAGGLGSVLGGGKFANGAITAAFAYVATTLVESEPPSLIRDKNVPTDFGSDRFIDRENCQCDRLLPGDVTEAKNTLYQALLAENNSEHISLFSDWDIAYVDESHSSGYGITNFSTRVTDIWRTILLSQDDINFIVAHEFTHLYPENHAIESTWEQFLNNHNPRELDADIRAQRLLQLPQMPDRFYCYGRGPTCAH